MTVRPQNTPIEKRTCNPSGVAIARSQQLTDFSSRQFAAVEDRLKDLVGLWRQRIGSDFLLSPDENPVPKTTWFHETLHKPHLIDAGGQEKAGELCEGFLTQMATAVQIISSLLVAGREHGLVLVLISRESARDRPNTASV